jgi:hypothetical protein
LNSSTIGPNFVILLQIDSSKEDELVWWRSQS